MKAAVRVGFGVQSLRRRIVGRMLQAADDGSLDRGVGHLGVDGGTLPSTSMLRRRRRGAERERRGDSPSFLAEQ